MSYVANRGTSANHPAYSKALGKSERQRPWAPTVSQSEHRQYDSSVRARSGGKFATLARRSGKATHG